MFSFCYDLLKPSEKTSNINIIINDHEIACSENNSKLISRQIQQFFSNKKKNSESETFSITIPEFENPLICSESDYEYFRKIFNLKPIQITSTNKNVLKIFATNLEIDELLTLIKLYEEFIDIINNDEKLQIHKKLISQIIDLSEDNFESTLTFLQKAHEQYHEIITVEFIYNVFLTACTIRPLKTEIFLSLLKKFDEVSKGDQYTYFKEIVIQDLNDNIDSKEIRFIVTHLYSNDEISREEINSVLKDKSYLVLYDEASIENNYNYDTSSFTSEEILEYKQKGLCPLEIYQIILKDDLQTFTEKITQKGTKMEFNDSIQLLEYERSENIMNATNYLELAAFYGSENIFNYILINVNAHYAIDENCFLLSIISGNINIIHKCLEYIEINDNLLLKSVDLSIKYNHAEIFEWLYENYNFSDLVIDKKDHLFDIALKYNNFDVVCYLLLEGFDYTCLFTLSLFYDHYYLAEFALKLPYSINGAPQKIKEKMFHPFHYNYEQEPPLFLAISNNRIDFIKRIVESDDFNPKVNFNQCPPLFFAVLNNKVEAAKYFFSDERLSNPRSFSAFSDRYNMFEYSILHDHIEMAEFLLTQSQIEILGNYSLSLIDKISKLINAICFVNTFPMSLDEYIYNFVNFFIHKSNDKYVNDKKKELINENIKMFSLLAAYSSNVNDFEQFLDDYQINDINIIDEKTIFLKIFLFLMKLHHYLLAC